jgi:hypothetical protein
MRDILDMALEAGFKEHNDMFYVSTVISHCTKELKRFEALVRADEREECAKTCEELVPDMSRTANDASVWDVATFDCATAIRARGTNDL